MVLSRKVNSNLLNPLFFCPCAAFPQFKIFPLRALTVGIDQVIENDLEDIEFAFNLSEVPIRESWFIECLHQSGIARENLDLLPERARKMLGNL